MLDHAQMEEDKEEKGNEIGEKFVYKIKNLLSWKFHLVQTLSWTKS